MVDIKLLKDQVERVANVVNEYGIMGMKWGTYRQMVAKSIKVVRQARRQYPVNFSGMAPIGMQRGASAESKWLKQQYKKAGGLPRGLKKHLLTRNDTSY